MHMHARTHARTHARACTPHSRFPRLWLLLYQQRVRLGARQAIAGLEAALQQDAALQRALVQHLRQYTQHTGAARRRLASTRCAAASSGVLPPPWSPPPLYPRPLHTHTHTGR